MLSVSEAQTIIAQHVQELAPETIALTPDALGLISAEDIASDLDMPPFDKAMMDGYAVRSADLADGTATLEVIEEVPAGQVPKRRLETGQATRIMTGAPVPDGCDAVVMVERSKLVDDG